MVKEAVICVGINLQYTMNSRELAVQCDVRMSGRLLYLRSEKSDGGFWSGYG